MDLDLLVRTSVLLLAALLAARLLPRAAAATRHLIWHAAVVAVLLAPAWPLFAPRFRVALPSSMNVALAALQRPVATTLGPTAAVSCEAITAGDCDTSDAIAPFSVVSVASILRAGTLILAGWFVFSWLASAWQAARATHAPLEWIADATRLAARLGFRRLPPVRQTRELGSPRVAGLFAPVILLPTSASQWSASDREAALLHELWHIRRADRRTQALAQLACALYWFNPLIWIASAALVRERERACDHEVLNAGILPSSYASLLLDLAKGEHSWTPVAALGMARPSTIEGRLLAILATAPATNPGLPSNGRFGTRRLTRWLVVACAALATTAILGAQQQSPSRPPSPASTDASNPTFTMLMGLDDREQPSSITQALSRALNDPDRQVREKAALGLALVPGAATIDPLLTALRDSDAQVREKAAIGLAFRRDERIVDPLLKAMGDTDAQVREKVAIALGASGDARATTALEKALEDPDAQVREKAAAGLILLGLRK